MMEMVERVAAAIYDRCNHWDYDDNLPPYSSLPDGAKAQWQDAAHHAIEAMRVPTEAMKIACWPNHHPWGRNAPVPSERPEMVRQMDADVTADWQAMIDAALSPNQKE